MHHGQPRPASFPPLRSGSGSAKRKTAALPLAAAALLTVSGCSAGGIPATDGPRLEVLAEISGAPVPGSATGQSIAPRVAHSEDGVVSITTAGHQGCPVLPTRVEKNGAGAVVVLAPVPSASTCGAGLQLHTTIVRVNGVLPPGDVQVRHDDEWRAR